MIETSIWRNGKTTYNILIYGKNFYKGVFGVILYKYEIHSYLYPSI